MFVCLFQIVLATLAMASGAPQYFIADTPEVQAAKAQFAAAWNAAAARNQVAPVHEAPRSAQAFVPAAPVQQYAPVSTAGLYEDGETWPEAVPYVHEDIAAEAYVHIEPANVPYIAAPAAPVAAPVQQYAPVQQAAPAYYNPAAYAYAPVAPVAPVKAGCFNWKGVAVECRY